MKKIIMSTVAFLSLAGSTAAAQSAAAITVPKVDSGDTAWMIVATALVLLMTIPGLALFYGGLVRRKNVLNVLMQCMILTAVISIEWVICGYSLAFGSSKGVLAPYIGGLHWAFLNGIHLSDLSPYFISHFQTAADGTKIGTIPHLVFIMYQCMFAVITPALIIGAFAERINFKGFLVFSILWTIFIYNPVAHWVWSADGWLGKLGTLDFAGGVVVHISAGIAAFVTAIMLGKRHDYEGHALPPHNIPFVFIGAALLWFGWFGFNAGSGLAADGLAANAFMVTHIATAAAALTWALIDWFIIDGKPTIVGICTGAVAGLVAITPAAGFVGITGALAIGVTVSSVCYIMVAFVKPKLGYDDSLDAFGVHGIGGIIGAIMTGLLATPAVQAYSGAFYGNVHQLWIQLIAVISTIAYSGIGTFILFKITEKVIGVRVTEKQEALGLDDTQQGETAYTAFD